MLSFNTQIASKLDDLKSTILKGHPSVSADISDDFLEKRFSKEKYFAEDLKYEFSADPEVRAQFYAVRGKMYRSILHSTDPVHLEDEMDRKSELLAVMSGDACVGGTRITISQKGSIDPMPMEKGDFQLKDVLSNIDLENTLYGEVSRTALLPQFANGEVTRKLFSEMMRELCINMGGELCLFAAYPLQARNVRQAMSKFGFKAVKIQTERPDHFHINERVVLDLYAIDMTPDHRFVEALQSQEAPAQVVARKEKVLEPA